MESSSSALMPQSTMHWNASKTICLQFKTNFFIRNHVSFLIRGEFFIFGLQESQAPIVERRTWDIRTFNYDNCAAAMITLFAVQTSEGWIE